MIYKKDASFPYPILSNTSESYIDNKFFFDIEDLTETNDEYIFNYKYEIGSDFINDLLKSGKACLNFVIQSKDNIFMRMEYYERKVTVPKRRLTLSERTRVQLQIQTLEEITMESCEDLSEFYAQMKEEINLEPYSLMGYSNLVTYAGSETKPLDIFERKVDNSLEVPFKVVLSPSTIVLKFKDERTQLTSYGNTKHLMNMYIYEGLSRALHQFIQSNNGEGKEEFIDLNSISISQEDHLNQKLYDLMINKGIEEISPDNIDEVIQSITNRVVEKFVMSIEEMANYAD